MHAGLGCGFFEGVEIHHHHVDRLNAMLGDSFAVGGIGAAMQDSAMHFGMQRLHPPIEHLGKAGEIGDIFDFDSRVAQQLGGAAGGDQLHAHACQLAGEIHQTSFVGDAQNRALNFDMISLESRREILSAWGLCGAVAIPVLVLCLHRSAALSAVRGTRGPRVRAMDVRHGTIFPELFSRS